jgi:hypothetical protein
MSIGRINNPTAQSDIQKTETAMIDADRQSRPAPIGPAVPDTDRIERQMGQFLRSRQSVGSTFLQQNLAARLGRIQPALSPLPEGKPDQFYDGTFVGAFGRAYPASTPIDQIPPVTPRDGRAPNGKIVFVNGIQTPKDTQAQSLQSIADKTGAAVIGIHNSTEGLLSPGGFVSDVLQVLKDKADLGRNPAVDTLAAAIYDAAKKGEPLSVMAHSQGALIASRAVGAAYNRLRIEDGLSASAARKRLNTIQIETFGGAARSYPDGPQYVHYVNVADAVPMTLGLGVGIAGLDPTFRPGSGAVIHRFTDFRLNPILSHDPFFNDAYLSRRVPFEDARRGDF